MKLACIVLILFIQHVYSWVPAMENLNLYEGDMVLRPDQAENYKQGNLGYGSKKRRDELWPNGEVPYVITSELRYNQKAMKSINEAFAEYRKYTCIKFKPRTTEQKYVEFHKGGGCSSWVGRGKYDSRHPISLDSGCWWKATVMHEIAHSLGFYHEQSRPDRDSYVDILFNNMKPGADSQFKKQTYSTVDSLGTPYDYESMMHYNWNAFGRQSKGQDFALQTIRTKDRSKQWLLGQRNGFSKTDVDQINKLYQCRGNYPSPPQNSRRPTDSCHDMQGCAEGKAEGRCTDSSWKYWMNKACRFTCGFCNGATGTGGTGTGGTGTGGTGTGGTGTGGTGTGGGSCKDRVNDCYKNMRNCESSNTAWKNYMNTYCKKSCRRC